MKLKRKTFLTLSVVLVTVLAFSLVASRVYTVTANARMMQRLLELQRSNASADEIEEVLKQLPDSVRPKLTQQQAWIDKAIGR